MINSSLTYEQKKKIDKMSHQERIDLARKLIFQDHRGRLGGLVWYYAVQLYNQETGKSIHPMKAIRENVEEVDPADEGRLL